MVRLFGRNIPDRKCIERGLTFIHGIGLSRAHDICDNFKIDYSTKIGTLSDSVLLAIRNFIDTNYVIEGDLKRSVYNDIQSLIRNGSRRGQRHKEGLPVHGQRTHTNALTRKGKSKPIAAKKKADKK